ncbi:hypothetical protein B4U79_12832 [Dinothrombium tinctorium]|uniref:peptidylprolyl isomerase n=1 Tax=Dinothrombium tinctorium TaxID=1965070 RepID=A0A443RRW4_9ACAR|nr:hypothetical protein B4U79_12832 [Dinothrombium tinctorium]
MFWGVILETGKRYSQKVESAYHLTMAALEPDPKKKGKSVSVMVEHEKSDYILCNLDYEKSLHQSLDLVFANGEDITFFLNGEGTVHLTGYILPDEEFDDEFDEESDELSDEEVITAKINDFNAKRKLKANDKAGGDVKKAKVEATPANKAKVDEKKVNAKEEKTKEVEVKKPEPSPKKGKVEADDDDDEDEDSEMASDDEQDFKEIMNSWKAGKKDIGDDDDDDEEDEESDEEDDDEFDDEESDLSVGSGPEAKKGKFLHVHYVGKLANNKEFDRSGNKPFSFCLGAGEVIKGWEVGFLNMKVGGKRRITVPASMGYGNKKVGAIPANSTLTFDVELKAIN